MILREFILTHSEPILSEWVRFARSLGVGTGLTRLTLLNHSAELLKAIAEDMGTRQSGAERLAKSEGHDGAEAKIGGIKAVSAFHGLSRVESGFDLLQVVAEYRALRSSVLELWRLSKPEEREENLEEVGRFNEAVDQALAEAVSAFSTRMRRSSDLFLAVLGHDMRGPLHSISMLAQVAELDGNDAEKVGESTKQIVATVENATALLDDLLLFTSSRLGAGLPIVRCRVDVAVLCGEVIGEVQGAYPEAVIRLVKEETSEGEGGETQGGLVAGQGGVAGESEYTGEFDGGRLRQAITNLVRNAVQHGAAGKEIVVTLGIGRGTLTLAVHNAGVPIDVEMIPTIFDPLVRRHNPNASPTRRAGSVGLGLYIVREVVNAHGGLVSVESTAIAGTTFTAKFPFQREGGPMSPAIAAGSSC